MTDGTMLPVALAVAVPLWAEQIRREHAGDWDYVLGRAKVCSAVIAEHGDDILFRSKLPGRSAEAFNRLAEGVACASFVPGGVTLFGQTWVNEL